jgi:hypothetical protein
MSNKVDLTDETSKFNVKQTKMEQINKYWNNWLIFKNKSSNDYRVELKKLLPPYFNSDVNKTNEFSVRDNLFNPPCPQEFLEHLLNAIILRNELGLYRSKYYFYNELQQCFTEYLKLFYFRMDTIIDIFQSTTKLSLSKEKYPKIVVKCSNCSFFVFIDCHCPLCQNEFYCDETCRKIHHEKHKKNCISCLTKIPKIIEPIRIEVYISSEDLGETIQIWSEHNMKFSKMMKGQTLLSFLFKSFRKEKWFRNNNYSFDEKISSNYITISRDNKIESNNVNDEQFGGNLYNNNNSIDDFLVKLDKNKIQQYINDEFRDLLRLSVLQELKLDFYKLGAILVDILCEQNSKCFKYILIFYFP